MQSLLEGGVQSAREAQLMTLDRRLVKRGVGELAPGEDLRIEHAEHDAAPFDEVDRAHQRGARGKVLGASKRAQAALDKARAKARRHRYGGLGKEISDHPRRIVPAGILEIEEYDAAIMTTQGIVEPEIGGRDAALSGLELPLQRQRAARSQRCCSINETLPVGRELTQECGG